MVDMRMNAEKGGVSPIFSQNPEFVLSKLSIGQTLGPVRRKVAFFAMFKLDFCHPHFGVGCLASIPSRGGEGQAGRAIALVTAGGEDGEQEVVVPAGFFALRSQ